jgi:hypothetical protein
LLRASARLVLAALALTIALAAPAGASTRRTDAAVRASVGGSIGLRLVDVPIAADNDPRARVYIVDHVNPGSVIHRRIEVSNTTASAIHVDLYSAAATVGASFFAAAGHTPNDVSTWTSVRPGSAVVAAGRSVLATVTIAVPNDATPRERYGVVWAETRSGATGDIVEVSRVGIRLYISVGPGGAPASSFAIRSLTAARSPDGRPVVVAAVFNNGGRALDMYGTLRLSAGPAGLSAGPFAAAPGVTLAIGDAGPVTFTLDKQLPSGPWHAQIDLQSGLVTHRAHATITFPRTGTSAAVDAVSARRRWPLRAIAVAVGLLAALAAVFTVARRRGYERPFRTSIMARRRA